MTSSIARMNCFLHGIEDFQIDRGDTLAEPKFVRRRPPPALRRRAGQSALLHQAVGPRRLRLRPVGPQPVRHAAAGPRRLRLLAAHPVQPRAQDRPLRHPVPARRPLPPGRGGDAAQAHRSRPHRMRPRPRAEPLLQLADGSLRRHLPHGQAQGAQRQNPLHQRRQRSHPRTRPELPHRRPHRAHRRSLSRSSRTNPASPVSPRWSKFVRTDGNLSIPLYVGPSRQRNTLWN